MKHELTADKDQVRIAIEGEVDMHVASELRDVLAKASSSKPALLLVDLAQVPFIDSSGIATIVQALKNVRKFSGKLVVRNCQEAVRDTFEIAGLTEILGIL